MNFLLETNVISEWIRPRRDPGVVQWLDEADEDRVFISVVTLAELRDGTERLPDGARRRQLEAWLTDDLRVRFEGRILDVDAEVADRWGRIKARRQATGRPIGPMDAFIAATAEHHGMTLVTHNISDFDLLGVALTNPWTQ